MSLSDEILADSPAGYWPFQVDFEDYSGNNRDGTNSGGSLIAASLFGHALDINGGGAYVDVADANAFDFDGTAISVEAWVNVDAFSATKYIIGSKAPSSGGGTHDWLFYYDRASTAPAFWLGQNGSGSAFAVAQGSTRLVVGDWYHIVGTYSGAGSHTIKIYVNGSLAASSSSTTGTASAGTSNGVRWGDYQGDTGDLKMAHCAIYDAELSAARILAHYEAGIAVIVAGAQASETDTGLAGSSLGGARPSGALEPMRVRALPIR